MQSRAGLGKTREVAQLATRLCAEEGWTVCVAKGGDADALMNRPGGFPDELRGAKLLFILDDLHRRTASEMTDTGRYLDRLDAFLHFFEQALAPGEFYALATARTESHHRAQLELDAPHPLWDRFKFYELPEFTRTGLCLMLVELAKRAGVDLESSQVEAMVSDSDRTIRTLVENVDRARWRGEQLTLQSWLPSQGKTWEVRSNEARAHWPGVDQVFRALHLTRVAGLPTRFEYVAQLGSRLGEGEVTPAAKGLVDMGLLGLRGGVLDAFGDEQLADSLRAVGAGLPDLATQWDPIIEAVTTAVGEHPNWSRDLYHLAVALIDAERYQDAESVAAAAIAHGRDDADVYYLRGWARSQRDDWAGTEADCTTAIAHGWDVANVYYNRGLARGQRDDWAGAEADFTTAIERGQDDANVYSIRGRARFNQGNWAGGGGFHHSHRPRPGRCHRLLQSGRGTRQPGRLGRRGGGFHHGHRTRPGRCQRLLHSGPGTRQPGQLGRRGGGFHRGHRTRPGRCRRLLHSGPGTRPAGRLGRRGGGLHRGHRTRPGRC